MEYAAESYTPEAFGEVANTKFPTQHDGGGLFASDRLDQLRFGPYQVSSNGARWWEDLQRYGASTAIDASIPVAGANQNIGAENTFAAQGTGQTFAPTGTPLPKPMMTAGAPAAAAGGLSPMVIRLALAAAAYFLFAGKA